MELLLLGLLAMGILGGNDSKHGKVGNVRRRNVDIMKALAIMSIFMDRDILDP